MAAFVGSQRYSFFFFRFCFSKKNLLICALSRLSNRHWFALAASNSTEGMNRIIRVDPEVVNTQDFYLGTANELRVRWVARLSGKGGEGHSETITAPVVVASYGQRQSTRPLRRTYGRRGWPVALTHTIVCRLHCTPLGCETQQPKARQDPFTGGCRSGMGTCERIKREFERQCFHHNTIRTFKRTADLHRCTLLTCTRRTTLRIY